MKMEPLAREALRVVNDGEVKFVPDRFSKTYTNWMENVHDWCISRQLWWGHRIPAWTCEECGHITVSETDPTECEHCHSKHIKQEDDVLDTWFSSALWPFSTPVSYTHLDVYKRQLFGRTNNNRPSRFLGEIPEEYVEKSGRLPRSERTEEKQDGEQPKKKAPAWRKPAERGYSLGGGYTTYPKGTAVEPKIGGGAAKSAAGLADFHKGDMVQHKAFGKGMVVNLMPMGGDALIEIAFDNVGTKNLMLKSASQHMTKL